MTVNLAVMFFPKDFDYTLSQSNVTFSFTERRHVLNISIIDDASLENNETFIFNITTLGHIQLEIPVTQIAVEINDNEGQ